MREIRIFPNDLHLTFLLLSPLLCFKQIQAKILSFEKKKVKSRKQMALSRQLIVKSQETNKKENLRNY